ncbi:ferredoxin family protein [Desulfitobacterium chlororespirans]|uniref:Ferredoxin like protein n=1 Tax=Desulfitobacterium chlororespirans DSM 11544 TaxID=1121395 RepID=A0A1M7UZ82_9FIRM|nr:4Fe-4S dicluster domain-containing protein [Desulfitobacterium chlororespirans]SHN88264.1 ferredoxin like protein [Desulfitobacterium chlororespirans DSM 11544]
MTRMSLVDKLALNKFQVDEGEPHILINYDICKDCHEKYCLLVCPAGLYSEQNGAIIVEWAGCLECGTCLALCKKGALDWKYPRGGFGIIYRQG